MSDKPPLPLNYVLRAPTQKMRRPPMLVLLHDGGSTETEMLKVCENLDGRFLIFSVRGPFQHATNQFDWYKKEVIGGVMLANSAQAEFSRQSLKKIIGEAINTFKVDPEQIFLLGFGHGAVIATNLLLTAPDIVKALVAISGELMPEIRTIMAPVEQLRGKHVLLVHGLQDELISVAKGRDASSYFASLPVVLAYQEYPNMGHYLTAESLAKVNTWLEKRLTASGILLIPETPSFSTRLGGVHIKVRNLERSITFYMRFLGLRLVERTGKTYAFLANNTSHSVLALQKVGTAALMPPTQSIGLYRIRFEVADQVSFARAYQALAGANIPVTLIDHMICWSMHFLDPDGNGLELYWDTRGLPGKADIWQGRDLPLSAEKILAVLEPGDSGQ